MFGGKKVLKFYTQSFLYLLMIFVFSKNIAADESTRQVNTIIKNLRSIKPVSPSDCPKMKEKNKKNRVIKKKSKVINNKIADTLGFIASEDNDRPVQFFFTRIGINTDGSPNITG